MVKKAKLPRRRKSAVRPSLALSPFPPQANPDADPFEIPRDQIPAGKEYLWIAIAVLGEPVSDGWLENFTQKGWRRVPRKRHPKFKSQDAYLTRDGLRLYERKIPKDKPALTEGNLAAIKQSADMDMRMGRDGDPYNRTTGIRIMPESWNESAPYTHIPSAVPPLRIDVQIPMWLSGRYQDAASALGLTNEVYAQRRILMHLEGQIDGLLMPADGAFDLIQKSFHWERDLG